ncbi:MAG: hypothetical protein WD354_06185 [Acidimicrobiia bacterium]
MDPPERRVCLLADHVGAPSLVERFGVVAAGFASFIVQPGQNRVDQLL